MNKLTDLDTAEVSLVKRGANLRRFALRKSEDEMQTEILKAVLDAPLEDEAKVDATLAGAGVEGKMAGALKGALKLLSAYKEEMSPEAMKAMLEVLNLPGVEMETEDESEDMESEDMPPATKAKMEPAGSEDKTMAKKSADGIDLGTVPDAVKPQLEALWKAAEDAKAEKVKLEKALEEERNVRVTKEHVERVRAEYRHLPGTSADSLGPVLKSLHEKAPEEAKAIEGVLKSVERVLSESTLLRSVGASRTINAPENSAAGALDARAREFVAKGLAPTYEQGYAKALAQDPALYTEFLREKGGR